MKQFHDFLPAYTMYGICVHVLKSSRQTEPLSGSCEERGWEALLNMETRKDRNTVGRPESQTSSSIDSSITLQA